MPFENFTTLWNLGMLEEELAREECTKNGSNWKDN